MSKMHVNCVGRFCWYSSVSTGKNVQPKLSLAFGNILKAIFRG